MFHFSLFRPTWRIHSSHSLPSTANQIHSPLSNHQSCAPRGSPKVWRFTRHVLLNDRLRKVVWAYSSSFYLNRLLFCFTLCQHAHVFFFFYGLSSLSTCPFHRCVMLTIACPLLLLSPPSSMSPHYCYPRVAFPLLHEWFLISLILALHKCLLIPITPFTLMSILLLLLLSSPTTVLLHLASLLPLSHLFPFFPFSLTT